MIEMTKDEQFALERAYYYKQTLTAAGNGEAIRIPSGDISSIAYQLDGDGSVQVTAYPAADILADTAVWSTLADGDTVNPAITAIRQVNSTGTTVLNVRAQ